jgi:protein O-mannosyl-transferase
MADPKTLKLSAFLDHFVRDEREDRRFCFITGSGASKESGIRTGAELVQVWTQEIKERYGDEDTAKWMQDNGIHADDLASHYSKIYDKRFEIRPKDGFDFLEREMAGAEPSCGYSVLVQILVKTNHNVVITVNFDSMVEDAMFTYTDKRPLVCGHESLAGFIRPTITRPLIAKIHRDIFLAPKSSSAETSCLPVDWVKALTNIFKIYTPLVIGYGGNDGSLMGFLENAEIEGGMFWCYRAGDGLPVEKIKSLVTKHNGWLIPIDGFDDMMIRLNDKLGYPPLGGKIIEIAQQKAKSYTDQIRNIKERTRKSEETQKALEQTIGRAKHDPWTVMLDASFEDDVEKRDRIYQKGIRSFPSSPELIGDYAVFLKNLRKDYDQAEECYKKALELDPNNPTTIGNYASFLSTIRKDYDQAEKFYKKALELDPNKAAHNVNYANFLADKRKDDDLAEKRYKKALELDPHNATVIGNYAAFLGDNRKDHDRAEELYKWALELDPNDARNAYNYASFLWTIRKDYGRAEELYKKALKLDPNDAITAVNYANFLVDVRKDYGKAEEYYRKALELDPNNVNIAGFYAVFLGNVRKQYDRASELYKKALELDPNNADYMGNYAQSVIIVGRKGEAKDLIDQACCSNPKNQSLLAELWFYRYANFYEEYGEKAYEELVKLVKDGARSIGWNFTDNIELAKKEGHPHLDKLEKLNKIITEDAPTSILDT